jgi:flagellar hook protein FlgE
VVVGAIDTIQTQGALQSTGKFSDMAIQGEGFFVMSDGANTFYTRDGAFDVGLDGRLVNASNGMYVMGWQADDQGVVDTTTGVNSINIPLGQELDATASVAAIIQGNLKANAPVYDGTDAATQAATADGRYSSDVTVVDSLGVEHSITVTFTKTADNTWSYEFSDPADPDVLSFTAGATGSLAFDAQGRLDAAGSTIAALGVTFPAGAEVGTIATDFTTMTQLASTNTATAVADGSAAGALMSFAVNQQGEILGVYSNGTTKALGQIATATFANPGGLTKVGSNMFGTTANSGEPNMGIPDTGGRGAIANGYLEMSNVDLAEQFTSMIMAERGFQANSRVITTSDEILQDLVNLKR